MSQQTLSALLWIAFFFLLLVSLLAGLIGFLKGIYKTTLKTIVKTIFVLVLVFLSPTFAVLIGNINLQGILHTENAITLQTYLANLITDTGFFSPINSISIYGTIFGVVTSLISFAVFFLGMILIQIFASPITAILYQGIFRWFLPVETKKDRKKRKKEAEASTLKNGLEDENGKVLDKPKKKWKLYRIPGGILGLIQEFVFVMILLTPISALCGTAIKNKQGVKNVLESMDQSEENTNLILSYFDTVNDSVLYKLINQSKLDSLIISKATSRKVNGVDVSFNSLIDSTFEIVNPLLENKAISYERATNSLTINYATLLSVDTIDNLTTTMIANPMFLSLLPPLIDSALNSISGSFFSLDKLDFTDLDYSSELTILSGVYEKIYDLGIKPMINGTKFDLQNYSLKVTSFSDEDIDNFASAVAELGKMEALKKNLPVLLASSGIYLNQKGYDIFPTEISAYDDIDWSKDLSIFVKAALSILKVLDMDLSSKMDFTDFREKFFAALQNEEKRNVIEKYICSDDLTTGILETDLFGVLSIPDILSSSLSNVSALKEYVSQIDFREILQGYDKDRYRGEVKVMFSLCALLFSEDSKLNINNLSSMDLEDEETTKQLVALLKKAKESKIFSSMYPSLMKAVLFNNRFDFSQYLFGLTPYNFNYGSDTFMDDFIQLLQMMPEIQKMVKVIRDEKATTKEKIEALDSSLIEKMLLIVVDSDFFNADQKTGIVSTKQKNVNIHTLLNNLLQSEPFGNVGFVVPALEDLQDIQWETTSSKRGEISYLTQIIEDMKKNSSFFVSDKHELKDIEDTAAFADILKCGLQSDILSDSVLSIIDQSLNQYLKDIGLNLTLNEMRTELWIDDSDRIGQLLSLLQKADFNDIDAIDPEILNAMLTIFYKMNFIKEGSKNSTDPFASALCSILGSGSFSSSLGFSFSESLLSLDDSSLWSTKTENVEIDVSSSSSISVTKTFEITTEGEIERFVKFFSILQDYGLDKLKSGTVPDGLLLSLGDVMDSSLLRKILSRLLGTSLNKISLPLNFQDFLSSMDVESFASLSAEDAKRELRLFDNLVRLSKTNATDESYLSFMVKNIFFLKDHASILQTDDETKTMEDDLSLLLDEFSNSKLMNAKKEEQTFTPLQQFFKILATEMNITKSLTLEDSAFLQESALNAIVLQMDSSSVIDEIFVLKEILHTLQGKSLSLELGKTINKEETIQILTAMNKSAFFHRYPISLLKDSFDKMNLSSYIHDPDTGTIPHELDFYQHLGLSQEDILFWQNDLDMIVQIVFDEEGIGSFFTNGKSFDDLSLSSGMNLDFLYYLGNMNLLKDSRSYLVYNLIDHSLGSFSAGEIFLSSAITPYGENGKVYRFEELFYSNSDLLVPNSFKQDKDKALSDLKMLKDVLVSLLDSIQTLADCEIDDIHLDFASLMSKCLKYDETTSTCYRSRLASEIIAGAMKQLFKNEKLGSDVILEIQASDSLDFYKNDHFLVNPIEGSAVDGLLAFASKKNSLSLTKTYFTYEELSSFIPLFGLEKKSDENDLLNHYLSLYSSKKGNSEIGIQMKTLLSSLPVIDKTTSLPSTFSLMASTDFNLSNHSYEWILLSLQSRIL